MPARRGDERNHAGTLPGDLARGALAGAAGWWVMDRVLRVMYDRESPGVRAREDAARGGVPALEVMAESLARACSVILSERERQAGGTVLQWTTGIAAGALYGAVRPRVPGAAAGGGLAYGAAFSLLVDEGMIPLMGFAPGPRAFPWQTHARGLVGHLVFGAVAEAVLDRLDRQG